MFSQFFRIWLAQTVRTLACAMHAAVNMLHAMSDMLHRYRQQSQVNMQV
jgi:hypothetical protein